MSIGLSTALLFGGLLCLLAMGVPLSAVMAFVDSKPTITALSDTTASTSGKSGAAHAESAEKRPISMACGNINAIITSNAATTMLRMI